jgi:type IV pilus assembly protein PilC
METYNYKIITPERKIVEGQASGLAAFWVAHKLKREKNTVLLVQRHNPILGVSNTKKPFYISLSSLQRIIFFRNLAMMLDSGIALSEALHNLTSQAKGFGTRQMLHNIYFEVNNGSPLSRALSRYPELSPSYVTKTIEVGEQSGTLSDTLDKVSQDLERAYELRRKVVSAVSYPIIIVFFMIITAILLIVMVLPQITQLFSELGVPLPLTTRILQAVGAFIGAYPFQLILAILITFLGFKLGMRQLRFRLYVHSFLLRVPIFGNLLREYSLCVITRALGTLLASGITFVQALEAVKGTVRNEAYIQSINKMYPLILQGTNFSDALRTSPFLFPDQFRCLVEVGEKTGKLRNSFEKSSTHYERSVTFQTQMLTTILEPLLMVIAGVLVGFLALSIFGPIYNIAGNI